ncbi:MAG: hypothetical protein IKH78_05655 [Ruminococcus sp.]|nr:hypothetical protein [Ruminococcus sp.]
MKILKRIVLVLAAFGIICAGFMIAQLFRYSREDKAPSAGKTAAVSIMTVQDI